MKTPWICAIMCSIVAPPIIVYDKCYQIFVHSNINIGRSSVCDCREVPHTHTKWWILPQYCTTHEDRFNMALMFGDWRWQQRWPSGKMRVGHANTNNDDKSYYRTFSFLYLTFKSLQWNSFSWHFFCFSFFLTDSEEKNRLGNNSRLTWPIRPLIFDGIMN